MQKGKFIKAMLAAAAVMTGGSVSAEAAEVYTLNPVVVTATRTEKADLDVPATTTVITAEDIKNKGYTSVFDALEQTIGVTSYSYSAGSGDDYGGSISRFYLRGMDKGTLVLVNGAPVNIMNYSSTEGVPLDAVEKIEVIRGSNSVLYGAEAMGGVVNIITKRGGETGGSASVTYGNYKKGYQVGVTGEKFTAFFDRTLTDTYDHAAKIFPKSSYNWTNGKGQKNSFYISGQLTDKLSIDWSHVESQKSRYAMEVKNGQLTGNIRAGSYAGKYEYDAVRNNINLIYNDKESQFKSILAYNSRRLDSKSYYYKTGSYSLDKVSRGTNYNVYGITFDNQKTWDFNDGKDHLTGGITFKREHYKSLANANDRIHRDAYSIYSSYSHEFTDRFTGILGMRGEFVKGNGWDKEQNVFLPQLQLLYKMNKNWSLYSNVGKSFDMPAINSKYYSNKIKNWKVNPQKGWTYEVGSKYINGKDSLKMDVFHMKIDDKFEWVKESDLVPGGNDKTSVQVNGGEFRNTGFEAEWVHRVNENWSYNVGLSLSNPEIKSGDRWVQDSARFQMNLGTQYTSKKFTGGLNFFFTGDREDSYYTKEGRTAKTYGYDHRTPDRVVLNSTLQYTPNDNHAIILNLYNLLGRENCLNENENWDLPYNWTLTYKYSF